MGTVSAVQTPQGSCDNMDSLDLLTDSLRGRAGEESNQLSTPTIEAPQGQRLHFRRVSEVFSLGGLGVGVGGGNHRRDSKSACVSPAVTPADCTGGLSIRNLFPYRHGVFELDTGQGTLVPSPNFSDS